MSDATTFYYPTKCGCQLVIFPDGWGAVVQKCDTHPPIEGEIHPRTLAALRAGIRTDQEEGSDA